MPTICFQDRTFEFYELELLNPLIEFYSHHPEENKTILHELNKRVAEIEAIFEKDRIGYEQQRQALGF